MERLKEKIWLARPEIMRNEALYVQKSLESGWITSAYNEESYIARFERSVEKFLGSGKAVALNSGTSAIHLALIMAGVQKGDLVFCSDLTFAASANPIVYLGAEPVFIDSEMDTMNMDPDSLEKAFASGLLPKAVVVVHAYGMPANMNRIMDICSRYGVPVIEDATESFGATIDYDSVGTIGDYGCLSFNGNKMITAGGTGGMLICRSEDEAIRAAFIASQAKEPVPWYEHKEVGYNYRMANMNAAFGCGQMEYIEERITNKRKIWNRYNKAFKENGCGISMTPGIRLEASSGVAWLSCAHIDPETKIKPGYMIEELKKLNIEARRIWKPLHRQPIFQNCRRFSASYNGFIYVSDYHFLTGICLPSDTRMTNEEQDYVIEAIRHIMEV